MSSERSPWLTSILGGLATVAGLVSFIWQFFVEGDASKGPWWLLAGALALVVVLHLYGTNTVRSRWRVLWSCRRIKAQAEESIDIAAGDCSWLPSELPVLEERLEKKTALRVRLICRRPVDREYKEAIDRLNSQSWAEVRTYAPDFRLFLRCIIVDGQRKRAEKMLLIEKHPSPSSVIGLIPYPKWVRRDHSATYVPSDSRSYAIYAQIFEDTFDNGAPWV